jgi:hypothetical protein
MDLCPSSESRAERSPGGRNRVSQTHVSTLRRISGALFVGSLTILTFALLIVIVSGAFPAFSAILGGNLAASAPHTTTFRSVNLLYAAGWVLQLLGYVVLTVLLVRAGDMAMAPMALAVAALAATLGILEATFNAGMTTWAAQEAAATGAEPAVYIATGRWVSEFKLHYLALGLSAQVGYGMALVKTGLVPVWVGGTALGWGLIWLLLLVVGVGAPAIVFVVPPVIGMALLSDRRIPSGPIIDRSV